jgi:hypothetical protein
MLNMGFFDIDQNIPIEIKSYGVEGKNREVSKKRTIDYITKNIEQFKKTIIIGDRAYFTYKFLDFLNTSGVYYIVRSRGDAINLDTSIPLGKKVPNKKLILKVREKVRIVKCKSVREKIILIHDSRGKNSANNKKYVIDMTENCNLITNLVNHISYSDDKILEIYKSRWDIEVFFKYLKNNFNFQQMKEKDKDDSYEKNYLCALIVAYITKILVKVYYGNSNNVKINESNLVRGVYCDMLYDLLKGTFDNAKCKRFCNSYIKKIYNKKGRSFPRTAKKPFTKWYVKGYSIHSQMVRIINAILEGLVDKLPKNLKTKAQRVVKIDGKVVNG